VVDSWRHARPGTPAVLTDAEKQAVTARVARVEAATGVQVVTALVDKADDYPELVWKAFALATSLAAIAVVALDAVQPQWAAGAAALTHIVPVLGAGALSALCAIFIHDYARLFLRATRRDRAVRRCAQAHFVDHDLA